MSSGCPPATASSGETAAQQDTELCTAALFYDYREAANPIQQRLIPQIPYQTWPRELHEQGPSAIVPLDVSAALECDGPASSPTLCANFVHICAKDSLETVAIATSQLFYVIRGAGSTAITGRTIAWAQGDVFTLPADARAVHCASGDSAFYWVHDAPLLRYLGVVPDRPRFLPTLYPRAAMQAKLEAITADPSSADANRLSVLLGHAGFPQTRTITHTIWAMFGLLPVGVVQAPHRHQSVALDFIIDCKPGCYSLVGRQLDAKGDIINPVRVDWRPGSAFITPPGHWHAHYNESGAPAYLLPIQDAGLHTHLRTLNILFVKSDPNGNSRITEEP